MRFNNAHLLSFLIKVSAQLGAVQRGDIVAAYTAEATSKLPINSADYQSQWETTRRADRPLSFRQAAGRNNAVGQ